MIPSCRFLPPQYQALLYCFIYSNALSFRNTLARISLSRSHFSDFVRISAKFSSDTTWDKSINPSSSWCLTQANLYPMYIEDLLILSLRIPSRLALLSILTGVGPPCRNPVSHKKNLTPSRCFMHSTLAISSESLEESAGMLCSLLLHPKMLSPYLMK